MCEPGGEQDRDWAAVAAVQCRLDREGGTKLFTDLVMSTKNDKIFQESIQLAICLLEGGNTEIQVPRGLRPSRRGVTLSVTRLCPAELLLQADDGRQQV